MIFSVVAKNKYFLYRMLKTTNRKKMKFIFLSVEIIYRHHRKKLDVTINHFSSNADPAAAETMMVWSELSEYFSQKKKLSEYMGVMNLFTIVSTPPGCSSGSAFLTIER
jgi:hypothetical protein